MSFNDIDELYEKFSCWKNNLKEKYVWTRNLQKELLKVKDQKSVVDKRNTDLQDEVLQLNEILLEARKTISYLTNLEDENKNLREDNEQLKCQLEESLKANEESVCKSRDETRLLHEKYANSVNQLKNEAQNARNKEIKVMLDKVKEKDLKICELEAEKKNLVAKQEEELIKVKIEYEEKLERVKMQLSARQPYPQVSTKTEEILRKKCRNLESQYKEKFEALQKEIKHLILQNSKLTDTNKNLKEDIELLKCQLEESLKKCRSLESPYKEKSEALQKEIRPLILQNSKLTGRNNSSDTSLLFNVDFTRDDVTKDQPKSNQNSVLPYQAICSAPSLKSSAIKAQSHNMNKKVKDSFAETFSMHPVKNDSINEVTSAKERIPVKRKKLFNYETNTLLD